MKTADRNQMIYDAFELSFWSLLITIALLFAITAIFKKADASAEGVFGALLLLIGATMHHVMEQVSEGASAGFFTVAAPTIAIALGGYLLRSAIEQFRGKRK